MKPTHLITGAFLATAGLFAPTLSLAANDTGYDIKHPTKSVFIAAEDLTQLAKRGRGRGGDDNRNDDRNDDRGGDRDHDRNDDSRPGRADDHPNRNDNSPSGRDRPRIPGGSGCDDPGDILEHPECRG